LPWAYGELLRSAQPYPEVSMKWTYDPQADAIYITLREGVSSTAVSLGVCDEVILDVDQVLGLLTGIEIIGAERLFGKLRDLLNTPPVILGD